MDKDLDIELIDDIDIVDDVDNLGENADLLKDFSSASSDAIVFSSDLGLDEVVTKEEKPIVVEAPVTVVEEPVVVEDIISKTYNLADTLNEAREEIKSTADDGFDAKASVTFIAIIFVMLVIFVLALPFIAKLASA